jgi:hypothetical protein
MKLLPTPSRLGQMWLHLESLWRGGKRRIMNTAHFTGFLVLISVLVFHAQESGMIENNSVAWQWNLTGGQFAFRFINKANGEALPIGVNVSNWCWTTLKKEKLNPKNSNESSLSRG